MIRKRERIGDKLGEENRVNIRADNVLYKHEKQTC